MGRCPSHHLCNWAATSGSGTTQSNEIREVSRRVMILGGTARWNWAHWNQTIGFWRLPVLYIYIICMYICVCPQVCMYISMCIYIYIIKYHTYTAHALTLILQRIATICAIPAAPACMQTTAMRCGFLWGQEGWFAAKGCVHTTLASTLRGWDPTAKRRKRRLLLLIPGRPGSYRTLCFRHFLTLRTPCWQFF